MMNAQLSLHHAHSYPLHLVYLARACCKHHCARGFSSPKVRLHRRVSRRTPAMRWDQFMTFVRRLIHVNYNGNFTLPEQTRTRYQVPCKETDNVVRTTSYSCDKLGVHETLFYGRFCKRSLFGTPTPVFAVSVVVQALEDNAAHDGIVETVQLWYCVLDQDPYLCIGSNGFAFTTCRILLKLLDTKVFTRHETDCGRPRRF